MSSQVFLMPPACRHEFQRSGSFQGAEGALLRDVYETICAYNYAVQPMYLPATLYAADHADIRAVDFGGHVADEVLFETKGVWQFFLDVMHSHDVPRQHLVDVVRGQSTLACEHTASEIGSLAHPCKYGMGCVSSFSLMNIIMTGCAA